MDEPEDRVTIALKPEPGRLDPKAPWPRHPDLRAFLAEGDLSDTAIDDFLATRDLPLVERGALTFLWRGQAERVELLRWIGSGVDRGTFDRIAGTDLWHFRIEVEDGGRFEYKLGVTQPGGEDAWLLDPRNPNRAGDPFGENSVAMTHGYARPEWSLPRGAPGGTVETLEVDSAIFGETRSERVYLPAGYPSRDHPVIIIHDGGEYAEYASLRASLDNLIDAGDIPPVVAVLIQAGNRMIEYPKGRRHARYVAHELLPAIEARYRVSTNPADRVLMGASLGAVASLATAFRFPGTFGGLVLKSGSFILDRAALRHRPDPVFHRVARLIQAARRAPELPGTRAFVSTGELEGLADENRALARFLRNRGVEVLFQSTWDGHHWHNWRDQLRDALMWVLRDTD